MSVLKTKVFILQTAELGLVNVIVYRDVYREGGPGPEERLEDIRSSRCVSGSNFDRCREKGKRHPDAVLQRASELLSTC
jgi:hypothetical protein